MSSGSSSPGEHVGVGHARHGNVLVALAAAVAGVGDAHQPRRKLVAEIALQDAVLDQHGFLRGLAFVVDVERAAAPGHGAVVDDRALCRWRPAVPIRPAKAEVFLRLKSASSPWPTASCSRTPGQPGPSTTSISPAGASRASSCRIAWRAASFAKCSGVFSPKKKSRATRPPPPEAAAGGMLARVFAMQEDIHARQRLGIFRERAVGSHDQNVAQFVGVAGANFLDARIVGAGRCVGAHHQFDFGGDFRVHRRQRHRIQTARRLLLEADASASWPGRWRSGPRCGPHAECARVKGRRCRRIRCARQTPRERRIPRKSPAKRTSPWTRPPSARSRKDIQNKGLRSRRRRKARLPGSAVSPAG